MEAASIAHGGARRSTTARSRPTAPRASTPPTARDAAFHHLRDHDLRRLLHGLLLHPRRPGRPLAGARHEDPGRGRRLQHGDPDLLVLHAALGGDRRSSAATASACAPASSPRSCSARRSSSSRSTSTCTSASRRRISAQATIFYGLTGLHGAHVCIGLILLLFVTIRAFRGHYSPEQHRGLNVPGIYWHFVDIMWIVVFTTVYVL